MDFLSSPPNIRQCPGCKVKLPFRHDLVGDQGSFGRYGVASPECVALSNEVFVKFFDQFPGNPGLILPVDAYAVQHPPDFKHQASLGITKRFIDASIQSVAIHLIILYLMLEKKMSKAQAGKIVNQVLTQGPPTLPYLEPPADLGNLKVTDIAKASTIEEHTQLIWQWAQSAWDAWSAHHHTIRTWCEQYGQKQ